MMMKILIYCPDRHISYSGTTPDLIGVGGGITARVRMSRALARLGHQVIHVGNCPRREVINGVEYVPLEDYKGSSVEVAVITSSGGDYDLSPYQMLEVEAGITVLWVHGVDPPLGVHEISWDQVFAVSRFIRDRIVNHWGIAPSKVEVTYNGYEPAQFEPSKEIDRDPFQLIYSSHPSKGLQAAVELLEKLRRRDGRFHLEVFGGAELWGRSEELPSLPESVTFHGMVGQIELANHLQRSSFSIQLQTRQEPGALAIPDAQRAGAIVIASPVGVYPELIQDGSSGLLVAGDPLEAKVILTAAEKVEKLIKQIDHIEKIQKTSMAAAISTEQTAWRWQSAFNFVLARTSLDD